MFVCATHDSYGIVLVEIRSKLRLEMLVQIREAVCNNERVPEKRGRFGHILNEKMLPIVT